MGYRSRVRYHYPHGLPALQLNRIGSEGGIALPAGYRQLHRPRRLVLGDDRPVLLLYGLHLLRTEDDAYLLAILGNVAREVFLLHAVDEHLKDAFSAVGALITVLEGFAGARYLHLALSQLATAALKPPVQRCPAPLPLRERGMVMDNAVPVGAVVSWAVEGGDVGLALAADEYLVVGVPVIADAGTTPRAPDDEKQR